jgi:hypothetical protein
MNIPQETLDKIRENIGKKEDVRKSNHRSIIKLRRSFANAEAFKGSTNTKYLTY